MFVSDLRHFFDIPDDAPAPARTMAKRLFSIVRAATAGDVGAAWASALPCERRPGRQPCPGTIAVRRTDVPPTIGWWCTSCADEGVISGWEETPYDLRRRRPVAVPAKARKIMVSTELAAALRDLSILDPDSERLVVRAQAAGGGAVLVGDEDDLDELLGHLAAEANHEVNRGRKLRLDDAYAALNDAINQLTT